MNGFWLLVYGKDMLCTCTQVYRPSTSSLLNTLSKTLYIYLLSFYIIIFVDEINLSHV